MEEWFKPVFWRAAPGEGAVWAPPIEMYEEKDKYVVKAELPGMKKDEIEVSITDNVLTIKGERKAEEEKKATTTAASATTAVSCAQSTCRGTLTPKKSLPAIKTVFWK